MYVRIGNSRVTRQLNGLARNRRFRTCELPESLAVIDGGVFDAGIDR